MIDMLKVLNVFDKSTGENVKVKVYTTKHAFERFQERSTAGSDEKIESAITQAVDRIVNYYPHEDGEFVVNSKSAGVKIPMYSEVQGNEFKITIPTALDYSYMHAKKEKGLPSLTFESISYMMFIEIEVD